MEPKAPPDKPLKFSTLSLNISILPFFLLYTISKWTYLFSPRRSMLSTFKKYLYIIHTLTSSEFINFPSYCHQIFLFTYIEACITVSIKKAEAIIGKILLLLPS